MLQKTILLILALAAIFAFSACADADTTPNVTDPPPVTTEGTENAECSHEMAEKVIAPSCTQGYTLHYCQKCSYSYSDSYVDAIGHTYEDVVTKPTCTKKGYTTHTCTACKHSYKDAETAATGHSFGEYVITKEATLTEKGVMTATCPSCGGTRTKTYEHESTTLASKGLAFTLASDKKTATLSGIGSCSDTKVTVPTLTPEGAVVTAIASYAFENTAVTEIILPDSVTEIMDYAFAGAKQLTRVNIPESIERIGVFVFANAEKLQTVLYSAANCKYAGKSGNWDYAFENSSVKHLIFSDTVETIPMYLCASAKALEKITFGKFLTEINYNAFENTTALKEIVLPEGLLDIEDYAFSGSALKKIILPASLTSIGKEAFYGCPLDQDALTLGKNITSIGDRAFIGTVRIGTLHVESTTIFSLSRRVDGTFSNAVIEKISLCDGITTLPQRFFLGVKGLKTLVLPDSFESLPESFLSGASHLESVTLGKNTVTVNHSAFAGCEKLTAVKGIENVKTFGDSVFANCISLKTVDLTAATALGSSFFKNSGIIAFTLPEAITEIPEGFFENCQSLVLFTIPQSVKKIGKNAFTGSGITALTLPKTLESFGSAFAGMGALKTVTIENGIKTIGGSAFMGCTALTELTLPDSVTAIGSEAFKGCTLLESVTLSQALNDVGSGAFASCTALERITLPETLTGVAPKLFSNCTALKEVSLPSGILAIGDYAFAGTNLVRVTLPDGCTEIGIRAFATCDALAEITFGESLVTVKEYAFTGCASLKKVALPDTVECIERFAFQNCTSLSDVALGSSLVYLGSGAFMNASELSRIYLPASLAAMKISTTSSETLPFHGVSFAFTAYTSLESVSPEWHFYFGNVIPNTTYEDYLAQ